MVGRVSEECLVSKAFRDIDRDVVYGGVGKCGEQVRTVSGDSRGGGQEDRECLHTASLSEERR